MTSRYLNSKEVANILGVNVSTIKRWTDSGKLESIRTPGGHRKFLLKHLHSFLKENKSARKKATLIEDDSLSKSTTILTQKGDYKSLVDEVLEACFNGDRFKINTILVNLYLSQESLADIFDNLLTHVLYRIGNLWENDQISIAEEHLATDLIRDSLINLRTVISAGKSQKESILLAGFEDDLHDLALKMVQLVLEDKGYPVLNSGARTPLLSTISLIKRHKPSAMFISSTIVGDKTRQMSSLSKLYSICDENNIELFVGGKAFDELDYNHPTVNARLKTFNEVEKCLA